MSEVISGLDRPEQSITVKGGDTLSKILSTLQKSRPDVTLKALMAHNNITNPNLIRPEQIINIPPREISKSRDVAEQPPSISIPPHTQENMIRGTKADKQEASDALDGFYEGGINPSRSAHTQLAEVSDSVPQVINTSSFPTPENIRQARLPMEKLALGLPPILKHLGIEFDPNKLRPQTITDNDRVTTITSSPRQYLYDIMGQLARVTAQNPGSIQQDNRLASLADSLYQELGGPKYISLNPNIKLGEGEKGTKVDPYYQIKNIANQLRNPKATT